MQSRPSSHEAREGCDLTIRRNKRCGKGTKISIDIHIPHPTIQCGVAFCFVIVKKLLHT